MTSVFRYWYARLFSLIIRKTEDIISIQAPRLAVTVSNASFHSISILMNVSELNKFCSLLIQSFLTLKFLFIDFQ